MKQLIINSKRKEEVIDITDEIENNLGNHTGLVNIFLKHTTAAITTADLDPGTDEDYINAFEKLTPTLKFNHPHNPAHFPDHFLSTAIGTSLSVPVKDGKLILGTWQRIVLIEFDGPRDRNLVLTLIRE